jgi:Holliday junction resolvase RusA-like endonuclease
MKEVTLKFDITPIAKQSVRVQMRRKASGAYYPHFHKDGKVAAFEQEIKWLTKVQLPKGWKKIEGPIVVEKLIYKFKGIPGEPMVSKPDLTDNLNKAFFDALQNMVYKDDCQIYRIKEMEKRYSNDPGIEVTFSF